MTKTRTDALTIGTEVEFSSYTFVVTELEVTDRPAVFGTGVEWMITLSNDVRSLKMATAASDKWSVV